MLGEDVHATYSFTDSRLLDSAGNTLRAVISVRSCDGEVEWTVSNAASALESRVCIPAFYLNECTRITLKRGAYLSFEEPICALSLSACQIICNAANVSGRNTLTVELHSARLERLPTLRSELVVRYSGVNRLTGCAAYAGVDVFAKFAMWPEEPCPHNAIKIDNLQFYALVGQTQVTAATPERRPQRRAREPLGPSRRIRRRISFTDNGGVEITALLGRRIRRAGATASHSHDTAVDIGDGDDDDDDDDDDEIVPREIRQMMYAAMQIAFAQSQMTQDDRDEEAAERRPMSVWVARLERKRDRILALHRFKGFLRKGQGAEELVRYSKEDKICKYVHAQSAELAPALDSKLVEILGTLSALKEIPVDEPLVAASNSSSSSSSGGGAHCAEECMVCNDAQGVFSICDRCSADKVLCESCLDNCIKHECLKECFMCRGKLRETARVVAAVINDAQKTQ